MAAENLTITIKNNEGLPAMSEDQFSVYQIFKGSANEEEAAEPGRKDDGKDQWGTGGDLWADGPGHWDDMSLADIEWGSSVPKGPDEGYGTFIGKLNSLQEGSEEGQQPWLGGENPFADVKTAMDVAKALSDKPNSFLQGFAKWLISGDGGGLTAMEKKPDGGCSIEVTSESGHKDDKAVIKVPEQGYYLFAQSSDKDADEPENAAVSEFMLAVMGNQEIRLKADVPTLTKTIDGSAHHEKGSTCESGNYVRFMLSGTLPKNFEDYKEYHYAFYDTLPKGYTYGNPEGKETDIEGPAVPYAYAAAYVIRKNRNGTHNRYTLAESEYSVTPQSADFVVPTENTNVKFEFKNLRKEGGLQYDSLESEYDADPPGIGTGSGSIKLQPEDIIAVAYDATLNQNAEVGYGANGKPNDNTAYIEYSNNPNADDYGKETGKTTEDDAHIYTFGLDMTKVGDDQEGEEGLEGAGFILTSGNPEEAAEDPYATALIAKFSGDNTPGSTRAIATWEDLYAADDDGEISKSDSAYWTLYDSYQAAAEAYAKAPNSERDTKAAELQAAIQKLSPYIVMSGEDGKFPAVTGIGETKFEDSIDDMPYYLTEIVTPAGYDTMKPVSIGLEAHVGGDDTPYDEDASDGSGLLESFDYKIGEGEPQTVKNEGATAGQFTSGLIPVKLVNKKAPILPHTGGIGALAVYGVSAAVLACGATLLIFGKKKRKPEA